MIGFNHIAVQAKGKEDEAFFTEVLGMEKVGGFKIDSALAEKIFKIKQEVETAIFVKGNVKIELFITGREAVPSFNHVCFEIPDRKSFVERCRRLGIKPIIVEKTGKSMLFVRDFSGNLFEIKDASSENNDSLR